MPGKEPNVSIIGCDLHSRYQVVALVDTGTGEMVTRRLEHENGEARAFYATLPKPSLIGIEATGYTHWFERLVAELGHELWVGDPAEIRARAVRRQKTDTRDAEHLLDLLLSKRFPRLWVPTPEERDARQLLKHRNKLVRMQTSVRNQLHFLAMSQGVCRKQKLWSARGRAELEGLSLGTWASRRRKELLETLDQLGPRIAEIDQAVKTEAERRPEAVELMKHKGVGPVTALAFVLTIGPVERFAHSRALVSYLGLNPSEDSSGGHQRLGHISKQGNAMLRWLLVEAGHSAAQFDPELRRKYRRLVFRRGRNVAKVALARHLAVRLYWTLRQASSATPPVRTPGSPK
ncbi:MAG: IS110 family transposase [Acidobacteria bacterium]|nr:MAG: IS110 family transposase [Acidobacteriota bacterium]